MAIKIIQGYFSTALEVHISVVALYLKMYFKENQSSGLTKAFSKLLKRCKL